MQFRECNEIDDKQAENIMRELGVKWAVETVELKKIDWMLSSQNHGRVNNLTPEQFDKLMADKRRGDQFPRCIFAKMPSGKYMIVSGCNRSKADREIGATRCTAYVIKFDPLECQCVAQRCNAIHGHGLSIKDQLRLAVDMVDGHGLQIKDVARTMALDVAQLTRMCHVSRATAQLLACNVSQAAINAIPDTTRQYLHQLRTKPEAMKAMAEAIAGYKIGNEEARSLIQMAAATESKELWQDKLKEFLANKRSLKSLNKKKKSKEKPFIAMSLEKTFL